MAATTDGESTTSRRSIRIFRTDNMFHTPFSDAARSNQILAEAGVTYVDRPADADIILGRRLRCLRPYGRHDKPFAIWTHEPRWSFGREPEIRSYGVRNPIQVMNAYNGDIYFDEFYYFVATKLDFDAAMRAFAAKPRRAVMLASFHNPPTAVMVDEVDRDLLQYRQGLALLLKGRGFCDIHGRGWPKSIEIAGNTREQNWQRIKMEILQGYAINLAFENTIVPKYVTEKIWHAVVCACLPVYHGGNGIYRLFPKGSFIDAEGKSVEELADEITAMPKDEMTGRYEACLKAYLAIYAGDLRAISRAACMQRTVKFLAHAIDAHSADREQLSKSVWLRLARRVHSVAGIAVRAWSYRSSRREAKYSRK